MVQYLFTNNSNGVPIINHATSACSSGGFGMSHQRQPQYSVHLETMRIGSSATGMLGSLVYSLSSPSMMTVYAASASQKKAEEEVEVVVLAKQPV